MSSDLNNLSVNSFNLNESITEAHELLSHHSSLGISIKKALQTQLEYLDKAFERLEQDISNLPEHLLKDSEVISLMTPTEKDTTMLINSKYIVGSKLIEKNTIKDFMDFTSKLELQLNQLHHDLRFHITQNSPSNAFIPILSQLNEISKNLKCEEAVFFSYKTDKNQLKIRSVHLALKYLQKIRIKLLKGETKKTLAPHEITALMKRIGDLEDRLRDENAASLVDFKELLFSFPEIDLTQVHMEPISKNSGASTSYFVYDALSKENENRNIVGVFKPCEGDAGLKTAVPLAESLMRQSAAFMIDKMSGGKAGVAFTLRGISDEGVGALQVFKKSDGALCDLTTDDYALIPAKALHFLSIQRLRFYDLDGHLGNVLWRLNEKGEVTLISIDHDYCFPVFSNKDLLLDVNNALKLTWSSFPQMNESFDAETKNYIRSLNVEKETEILFEMGFSIESINLFKATTWFIKEAHNDLLPGEILDYFLSENYSGNEKYEFVRFIIDLQDQLAKTFLDPIDKDRDAYAKEFENQMKPYIKEKVKELASNGSWRRTC